MNIALRARTFGKKVTLITTAFVLAVSSLTAAVPFILSQKAGAVSSVVYKGIPSPADVTYPSLGYAATSTDELGDLVQLGGTNRLLDDVTVHFTSWACETGGWNTNDCATSENATFTHPVTVNLYNEGTAGTVGSLIATKTATVTAKYRPSYDSVMCTAGKWYDTATAQCYNGIGFSSTFDFSAQNTVLPEKVIVAVAYNTSNHGQAPTGIPGPADALNVSLVPSGPTAGSNVNPDDIYWDTSYAPNYTDGGAAGTDTLRADTGWTGYNLAVDVSADALPTTVPCSVTTTQWFTNLSGWDTSETRSQGSSTVTGDGIRLQTWGAAGNPDQRKAAAYLPVNYPMTQVGTQTIAESMTYEATSGITPGLQLVVDFNNDGTPDGILVGESIYGNDWWLSGSSAQFVRDNAPVVGGGFGSQYHGTLNQWLSKFPTAQVKAIGYSLGSGVTAEGTIKSITLGCTTYKFDNVAPGLATHLSPSENALINYNNFWFDWSHVEGAVRYEIQNSTNPATDGTGSFQNVMWTGDYQHIQPTASQAQSVGATGTWYWQVRAIDAAGNAGAWTTPWAVTIDMTAPGAPTLVTPDWYIANGPTKTLDWNAPADTDVAYYEYAEYNNTAPSSDTTAPSWTKQITAPTTETTDTAWQSDVKIFWRVRAVDTAGNVGPWSETRTIVTDRTDPTSTDDLASVVGGTVTVTQHIEDNFAPKSGKLRIWKLVDGTTNPDNLKFYAIGDVPVDGSGNVVYTLNTANLYGSGQYIAKFTATDRAGNAIVTQKYFTVDTTAPIVTITSSTDDSATPTLTGTVDDTTATVTVTIDGTDYTAINNGDGTWTYTVVSPLDDGDYNISVVATDGFANASTPATATLTIATAPAPTPTPTPTPGTDEEEEGETTTNQPQTVTTLLITPTIINPAAAAVLGTNDSDTTDTTGNEEVEGASTESTSAQAVNVNSDENQGKLWGIDWYWWLIIIAAIIALLWAIIVGARRRQASNE